MGVKVCMTDGCFQPTAGTRCPVHEAEYQRGRNQRKQRGTYNRRSYRGASLAGMVCACCGVGVDLTRHHVLPLAAARVGVKLPDWACGFEVVAMCRRCNSSIADRFMETRECPMHGGRVGGGRKV